MVSNILIGYTGFVGSNLCKQHNFDGVFNSKNINAAFDAAPSLCVYAGIRAEKFNADKFPEKDLNHIKEAIENIKKIKPKKLVLISTVDVIPSPQKDDIYEDTEYNTDNLTPYGQNRLYLENEICKLYPDGLIIRLPALFGDKLKKNFIYDIINFIPGLLKKEKYDELCAKDEIISDFYKKDDSGFFRLTANILTEEKEKLIMVFKRAGFSALNFTDTRSKFTFYNLKYLWNHIEILLKNQVKLAHLSTEPISAGEVYHAVYGETFKNELATVPFDYSFFKTRYAELLGGENGYIFDKNKVVSEIAEFVSRLKIAGTECQQ